MPKDELEGVNVPLSITQELAAEAALLKVGTRIVTGLYSFLVVALAVAVGGAVWVTETNAQIRSATGSIEKLVEEVKALREDVEEQVKGLRDDLDEQVEAGRAALVELPRPPRWVENALSRIERQQERQQAEIDGMRGRSPRNGG